jgi:[acyl-carrier-protein] S-malonyltransferase
VRPTGVLEVTNLNSPRQQVLSGEAAALQAALDILGKEFYVQTAIIEQRVPMHCSIFEPVGRVFREYLCTVPFAAPRLPYLPNVLGEYLLRPRRGDFVEILSTHVHRPVLWRKSIDFVVERHPDAFFVEVGPMAVLHNLLDKKWRTWRKLHTDSQERTEEHLCQVIAQLGRVARTLEMTSPGGS